MEREPQPEFMRLDHEADGYQSALALAKESLELFKANLDQLSEEDFACVKFYIPESLGADQGANIWLMSTFFECDFCIYRPFELPVEFEWIQVGQWLKLQESELLDWYILYGNGEMAGGYSLRYQRSKLDKEQQAEFDQRVGVTRFIDL